MSSSTFIVTLARGSLIDCLDPYLSYDRLGNLEKTVQELRDQFTAVEQEKDSFTDSHRARHESLSTSIVITTTGSLTSVSTRR